MDTIPYHTPTTDSDRDERAPSSGFNAMMVTAVVFTPIWAIVFPFVISDLPRPMQGESVTAPVALCVVPYLAVPALLPAVFLRTPRARMLCVVCLSALALGWYFGLGFDGLLSKAYGRGL